MTATAPPGAPAGAPPGKGLKVGAIGLVAAVVIGVASAAPGYSIAASLGFIAGEAGDQAPAVMWLAFVPMLCIAAAYFYLNRVDPDCGTAFSWLTRSIGPRTGWLTGWSIILANLVLMPSLAGIAGIYFFELLGLDGLARSTAWTTVAGVVFIVAMTWVCVIGIEVNARTQFVLLSAEVGVLVLFSVVALVRAFRGDAGTVAPSLSWLNPFALPSASALSSGLLIAIFLYWGWDTAVTVNEETRDSRRTPGRAALRATVVLVGSYLVVAIAAQSVRGSGFLADNASDVLSATGRITLGGTIDELLILTVLVSAAASTQTSILPAARSSLSVAAHRAAPEWFARVNPKYFTPANATWCFGAVSVIWYVGLTLVSQNVLADSVASVGFMIAFYYGLTGFACVVYFRRSLFTSARNFVFVGLAPLVGGVILAYVFVQSCIDYADPANSPSGSSWFGVGPPLVIGVGLILLGVPLMLGWRVRAPQFFARPRDPLPHPEPDGTGPSVPPLSVGGVGSDPGVDGDR